MRDWIVLILAIFSGVTFHFSARAGCERSIAESPGRLSQPKSAPGVLCDRPFVYRGEVYSVDSPQAQDAATLKSFMKDVPEAEAILQTYQDRRERSKLSAYTGTVGIVLVILANTVFKSSTNPERQSLHSAFQIGGLALTAGGFIYSYSLLRTNELLIPEAVDRYNRTKPTDPIELKFQAGWSF
jgi:hypothetical protein